MPNKQGLILDKAREEFKAKNYSDALKHYEYFFDHALDDDSASYYGVRLSYCLSEWAKLGEQYAPALERLKLRQEQSLKLFVNEKEPEHFHDFMAFCRYLDQEERPCQEFLKIHAEDTKLASEAIRFIWGDLVKAKQWTVCIDYLSEPDKWYQRSLQKFDQAMKVCMSDESLGGEDFARQIKGWYVRDVSNILLVLKHNQMQKEFDSIFHAMESDLKSRNFSELRSDIKNVVEEQ